MGKTPQKSFCWEQLEAQAKGARSRGLVFVAHSHILGSSKPSESESLTVTSFPSILWRGP